MPGISPSSNSSSQQAPKRGPLSIAGRLMLLGAALLIVISFVVTSRKLPDHSGPAVTEIKRLEAAESQFFSRNGRYATGRELPHTAVPHYTFTIKPNKFGFTILAIPDDPRQKSFYADETLTIRFSPGTQEANADSPVFR